MIAITTANANTSLYALANGRATAPMVCSAGEQEAAEDRAVDVAEPADDRRAEADHAEQQAHAEVDLVVIEAVHHAGEGREPPSRARR